MINDKNRKQEGGDDSSNIQADNVNVYNGLSYKDVKDIATDIFKSNFIQLKQEAAEIAQERAEEISEKILKKVKQQSPESLKKFSQPGMQDALFTAQKEYAKSGDKELGDLLVDIIVDRAETSERNMLQIVLDESLHVAPKITIEQLDTLTLNFLLCKTRRLDLQNFEEFKAHLNNDIFTFVENLQSNPRHYNFLEYLRCGQIRAGNYGKLEQIMRKNYQGLFSKGFTKEELEAEFENLELLEGLLIPCFHDKEKLQIGVIDIEGLEAAITKLNISYDLKSKIRSFFEKSTLKANEVKNLLISVDNKMEKVFDVWDNSYFKNFDLSSMGIAIAHANYRRRTNETMDLSIWIK